MNNFSNSNNFSNTGSFFNSTNSFSNSYVDYVNSSRNTFNSIIDMIRQQDIAMQTILINNLNTSNRSNSSSILDYSRRNTNETARTNTHDPAWWRRSNDSYRTSPAFRSTSTNRTNSNTVAILLSMLNCLHYV